MRCTVLVKYHQFLLCCIHLTQNPPPPPQKKKKKKKTVCAKCAMHWRCNFCPTLYIIYSSQRKRNIITSDSSTMSRLYNIISFFSDLINIMTWWHPQMATFFTLLAFCAGYSPVTVKVPSQRPVTRSFDVVFDLRLNERLSKQSCGRWFETPSRPLWRQSKAKPNRP